MIKSILILAVMLSSFAHGDIQIKNLKATPSGLSAGSIKLYKPKEIMITFFLKNNTDYTQIYNKYCTISFTAKSNKIILPIHDAGSDASRLMESKDLMIIKPREEAKLKLFVAFALNNKSEKKIILVRSNESGEIFASDPIKTPASIELTFMYKNDLKNERIEKLIPYIHNVNYRIIQNFQSPTVMVKIIK